MSDGRWLVSARRSIYLDTNVFAFAQQDARSDSAALLEAAAAGSFLVVASDALIEESARLFAKLFGAQHSNAVRRLLLDFPVRRYLIAPEWEREVERVRPHVRDPADERHFAAALAARADVLVTYNRRSVHAGMFNLVPIAAPAMVVGHFARGESWPTLEAMQQAWEEWAKRSPRGPRAGQRIEGNH